MKEYNIGIRMSEQKKKLVVIDGKSVFYRGYYAMPGLSTKEGTPTGGVYGFAVMALEVIKRLKPDYVCVAWDKPKTNIRRRLEIYSQYKAGRKPAPPDFYVQIPILHELLRAFNWPLYEVDDYEADDIMATLAHRGDEAGIETVLISSDLDMLQCLSETTSYYVLKSGLSNIEHYRPEEFEQKYGIRVDQFVDLKSLKGDGSDNIPGVPGIGEKGAVELLKAYGTLDGVYENIWQIKGAQAKKLEAGKDLAYMSKELVILRDDAPVPLDLKHMDMANMDPRAVEDILRKLEFKSLVRQLPDVMRTESSQPAMFTPEKSAIREYGIEAPETAEDIESLSETIVVHARYADKLKKELIELVIAEGQKAVIIPAVDLTKKHDKIMSLLKDKLVIGYDTKALVKHLWHNSIDLDYSKVFDTHIAAFMVNSLVRDQSLVGLARDYLDLELEANDITTEKLFLYECAVIERLRTIFERELEKPDAKKMRDLYRDVELPSIPILARMEEQGILLNMPYFSDMSIKLEGQISDLEQTIYGYADDEFNIASPAQLATVLFEKLALAPRGKKGKNGSYSTAVDVLESLKTAHPIIDCIMAYRELTKLKSTYVDPLPLMVDSHNRLHTTYNMTVAQTGRLSSADPNLQNIPVRTELGRLIREGFVADPGNIFISADYSQFELRLAAVLAHDTDMIEAFNSDIDIHTLTASQVFGVALEDVTKDMRYQAKAVNFGILYGQTPHGLAIGTGMTFTEAKDFIDRYFAQRQPLLDYIAATKQKAVSDGYVETLYGRRRLTPDVRSSNFMVREGAFRQAVNMPVQGTEADLMKMAMIELEDRLANIKGAYQVLQVHDSILVECDESDAEKVGELMQTTMENIAPDIGIKLKVDVHTGKTWGEL
jgi:DNA polymerase-1